ncbi:hypothetical protein MTO96_033267 [Rhipicephalus appendiculatus]
MADSSPEGFPRGFVLGDTRDRSKDWYQLLKTAAQPLQQGVSQSNLHSPSPSPTARTRARKLKAATTLLKETPPPSTSRCSTRGTGKFTAARTRKAAVRKAPPSFGKAAAADDSHLVTDRYFPTPSREETRNPSH